MIISAIAFIVGSLLLGIFVELTAREVENRLDRISWVLLRLARRRLPKSIREEIYDGEWAAELHFILKSTDGLPLTRLIRGASFAFGLLVAAPTIGRELAPHQRLKGFKGRTFDKLTIGFSLTGLCALVSFSFDVLNGEPVYFFIALGLALAPVPVLLAAVLTLDRMEPEPRRNLIFVFAWGAGVTVLVAGVINSFNLFYIESAAQLGYDYARNLTATFGAPVVEETMKGLVLLGLLRFKRTGLDGPTDGIIYASMVGLGFAMSENVSYYVAALDDLGAQGLAVTVVLRGILSPLAHPLFTSMIGVAVAYAAQRQGPIRIFVIAAGWIGAMALHGIWNGFTTYLGVGGLAVAYLILMVVLFVMIWIVFRDHKRIVGLIQAHLHAYRPTGLVSPYDVEMLSSLPRRRQARQWAKRHGGRSGLRAMNDYQLASTKLGLLHEQARCHMINNDAFEKQRHLLHERMRVAKSSFVSPRL